MSRFIFWGWGAVFVLSLVCLPGLEAQSAEADDDQVVEEILVTGLRRAETVLETPASITAIGAEALQAKGVSDIRDIQYLVPSLQFGEYLGRRQVAIRGIGEFADAPGVMVSVDGVVQSVASSSGLSQLDLERVEVLRGPQGTLYGRNATGGAINFIAAKPTSAFEGYLKAGYAEFETVSIEGVLSGPIGDRVRYRLAANYLDANKGWIENQQPGEDDLMMGEKSNLRLIVAADLTDSLEATFTYGRAEQDGVWDHHAMVREHYALGVASGLPPLDTSTTPPSPVLFTTDAWEIYSKGPVDTDREYESISLTLDWGYRLTYASSPLLRYRSSITPSLRPQMRPALGFFSGLPTRRPRRLPRKLPCRARRELLSGLRGFSTWTINAQTSVFLISPYRHWYRCLSPYSWIFGNPTTTPNRRRPLSI